MSLIPDNAHSILCTSDEQGVFKFEWITGEDVVPDDARYDNWIEIDEETYSVYVMPDTAWIGASAALAMWADHLFDDEEQAS